MNLQTGDSERYPINQLPDWIDRAIPLGIIDVNIKKWGEYRIEGWWYNAWHDDKAQEPTAGWYLTYDQEQGAQWFSGFTSTSSTDQAMTGFTLTNARTMETTFFKATGVTEKKANDAARSLWSNFAGYEPCELVPYNLGTMGLTYVIPMKFEGQFKGVSLVALHNVNINGKGKTLNEALANYRSSYVKASKGNRMAPGSGDFQFTTLSQQVTRVGTPFREGDSLIIPFLLTGHSKRFQVPDSRATAEAIFLQPGDWVNISFIESQEMIITCDSIDIIDVALTDENPAQSWLEENQYEVQQETDRVDDQYERERLLESDRFRNLDPNKLNDFLREQDTN